MGGTKECLVPGNRRNLRGQNNHFRGTIDLEFEGTKQGFWGDQTMIFGGPKSVFKLKSLPNFHFLVNLGLKKYNNTLLATL